MKKRLLMMLPLVALILAGVMWGVLRKPPHAAMKRIGVVRLTAVDDRTLEGFKEGMVRFGYVDGQTVRYLVQPPSGNTDTARQQLRALLDQGVDALLVSSTPVTQIAKELTQNRAVPVIFAPVNDPVAANVVASLREPGGNLTGIRLPLGDKLRLQWLREIAPGARRVVAPYTRTDPSAQMSMQQLREAAPALGLELLEFPMEDDATVASIKEAIPQGDAIFLPRDSRMESQIAQWLELARLRRQPLSAPGLLQVEQGALYSYGFIHRDIGNQASRLMDQVLRGIPPGQLPVEAAECFLGINLRAAEEIGLQIPESIIRQATLVIRR